MHCRGLPASAECETDDCMCVHDSWPYMHALRILYVIYQIYRQKIYYSIALLCIIVLHERGGNLPFGACSETCSQAGLMTWTRVKKSSSCNYHHALCTHTHHACMHAYMHVSMHCMQRMHGMWASLSDCRISDKLLDSYLTACAPAAQMKLLSVWITDDWVSSARAEVWLRVSGLRRKSAAHLAGRVQTDHRHDRLLNTLKNICINILMLWIDYGTVQSWHPQLYMPSKQANHHNFQYHTLWHMNILNQPKTCWRQRLCAARYTRSATANPSKCARARATACQRAMIDLRQPESPDQTD